MDKELELKRYKNIALSCLAIATIGFISTIILPKNFWIDLIKAVFEAAMVGALADWFAVVALFRKVPIPLLSSHTEIIPKNKDNIADNLSIFVRDKFFDVQSIAGLIRKYDLAQKISDWLVESSNTERLGHHLVKLAAGILDFIEDAPVRNFITQAVHTALEKVDLSKSAGVILESLTKDGHHQALLNEVIDQFAKILCNKDTQTLIANGIVRWLKVEHPLTEKVLPSEWIGRNGAKMAVSAISRVLNDINSNSNHSLRKDFDIFTEHFIHRLKQDPEFIAKGEEIKSYLQNDPTLNAYLKELWGSLRNWLKTDLNSSNSILHQKIVAAGQWVGKTLANDPDLRKTLNYHLEESAKNMAPDFAQFLTKHISDTVKNWDSKEMSQQIELNIGKDLQFIRINGTIVGGLIGLLLYIVSHIPDFLKHF